MQKDKNTNYLPNHLTKPWYDYQSYNAHDNNDYVRKQTKDQNIKA